MQSNLSHIQRGRIRNFSHVTRFGRVLTAVIKQRTRNRFYALIKATEMARKGNRIPYPLQRQPIGVEDNTASAGRVSFIVLHKLLLLPARCTSRNGQQKQKPPIFSISEARHTKLPYWDHEGKQQCGSSVTKPHVACAAMWAP